MSAPINDGGPAFPVAMNEISGAYCGMTLRDWFAGQALTGILLAPGQLGVEAQNDPEKAAAWSYVQADAMLAARERKEEGQ